MTLPSRIHRCTCFEINRPKWNKIHQQTMSLQCNGFFAWCHSMSQHGKVYIQALVKQFLCVVKCVCLNRLWLCTCILKLLLQIGKYLQFKPWAKEPQGLFNALYCIAMAHSYIYIWKMCFCCCSKLLLFFGSGKSRRNVLLYILSNSHYSLFHVLIWLPRVYVTLWATWP